MVPSLISSASIPTPSRSDAAARKICRISAQACRTARPDCCTERLPEVTPSLGLPAVDARTICTRPISTSSSSAAIWASAVTMPCPISTLPGETITCPSGENRTHDDSTGFAARLTGNLARGGGGRGLGHRAAISAAARSTARTMRLCEPQRQRLRSSAALTSSPVGFGFRIKSCRGAHQYAGNAIAALQGLLGDERALQRMRRLLALPSPSIVVMSLSATDHSGVSQAATA